MDRTPNQKKAIETLGRHLCVDAGAGSGKTMVLIDRVLHILEGHHAKLEEIVGADASAAERRPEVLHLPVVKHPHCHCPLSNQFRS